MDAEKYWDKLDKKYDTQADPWSTLDGSESRFGTYTDQGTFVPDIGGLYKRRDAEAAASGEAVLPSEFRRREYAAQALNESIGTEERLRASGIEVPPVGTEAEQPQGFMRYAKYPLEVLRQLQRGQFAVVGGIQGVLDADPASAVRNFYRGLIFAEPHSVGDILEKYDIMSDSPVGRFAAEVVGDTLLDPLTWLSFGTYGIAKGAVTSTAAATMKAAEITPHLSRFGRKTLETFMTQMSEDAAVRAIVDEVRKGGVLGKKLIPSGVRVAHWVPSVGGQRVTDLVPEALRMDLVPGGVMQRVNDLRATQTFADKVTEVMLNNPVLGPAFNGFGKAFIPHFLLKRKYPLLVELENALQFGDHEVVRQSLAKAKELLKLVPDIEDRRLLTEIFQDPSKLMGKKFVTLTKTDPGTMAVKINRDYFPAQNKITENDVEELVDFLIETRNALRGGIMDIHGVVQSGNYDSFALAGGANGMVYGGSKFEPIRNVFEGIFAAHPDLKEYKIWMGDWVVKIPGYGGIEGVATEGFHYSAFKDIMGEIYSGSKLGRSGATPMMAHTFRRLDQLAPEMPDHIPLRFVNSAGSVFTDTKKRLEAIHAYSPQAWWAFIQGAWRDFQQGDQVIVNLLGGATPNNVKEFADVLTQLNPMITANMHYLPILVKKFFNGKNLADIASPIYEGHNFADFTEHLVKRGRGVSKMLRAIGRTGIEPGDLHDENMMMDALGNVVWVDNARFIDYIREVSVGEETFVAALPGNPRFEELHGAVEGAAGSPETYETYKIRTGIQRAMSANERAAAEDIIGTLDDFYLNSSWSIPMRKQKTLELVQRLKKEKIITEYSLKSDGSINSLKMVGFDIDTPLAKTLTPATPPRDWEEQVEVLAQKHPRLLAMSADQQDKILAAYNMAKSWKQELEKIQVAKGLIDPKALEQYRIASGGLEHLPGYQGPIQISSIFLPSKKSMLSRVGMGRQLRPISGEEIGSAKKAVGITEANRTPGVYYEDDIAATLFKHAVDVGLASNSRDFIAEAARLWGKPIKTKNVMKGGKQVAVDFADPGFVAIKNNVLKGIQIPEEVAEVITRYTKTFSNESGYWFTRTYDKLLNAWKGYATYTNPGFHGRNFISNVFQLYLKDGPEAINPTRHWYASRTMAGADGSFKLSNGTDMTYKQALKFAEELGVYGRGWFGSDIKTVKDIQQAMTPGSFNFLGKFNPVSQENLLFQAGKYVGGGVENEARMVGFINDLIRTNNPHWAAMNTKKFLFDYNDITPFEQDFMKRVMPFYTWLRKNIALQAEQIIKQPAKYANVERVRQAIERAAPDVDERWTPTYFPELYAIKTPIKSSKGSIMYLNPNLPFQDLNKMFSPQDWISSLGPWKTVLELASNKNFFTMRDIQKYKGERVEFPIFSALPKSLQNSLGPLIGAEQVYEKETGRWFWGIPPKVKYAIDATNPFLKNFGKVISETEDLPHYMQEKNPWDKLAWGLGAKFIPYNEGAEMEKNVFRRRDIIRNIKKTSEQQGRIPSYYLPNVPESH